MSAGEMAALIKQVAYWKELAQQRYEANSALAAEVNEMRDQHRRAHDQSLIVPPQGMPPAAARDRANAARLAADNERLRLALEASQRRAVELEQELKHLEGNPS